MGSIGKSRGWVIDPVPESPLWPPVIPQSCTRAYRMYARESNSARGCRLQQSPSPPLPDARHRRRGGGGGTGGGAASIVPSTDGGDGLATHQLASGAALRG